MDNITRPAPVGEARHGPTYDIAEVVAYRKARGVTQVEVAQSMHVSQPFISMLENAKRPEAIKARTVLRVLDAIDLLGTKKARMVAEGLADLERIRVERPGPGLTERVASAVESLTGRLNREPTRDEVYGAISASDAEALTGLPKSRARARGRAEKPKARAKAARR
jgi:transcriptional regulator with XRE-family HTH domain